MDEEYQSGLGKKSQLPPELKRWNWGACFLNWIWGIGNSTYIAFLMFVPLVNIVMFFVLGAKGNKWAWQNRTWDSIEHFKKVQRRWSIAGLFFAILFVAFMVWSMGSMMKGEAYELSLKKIQQSPEVIALVGEPIVPGFFVSGSISSSGEGIGYANLSYSISGPNNQAYVVFEAHKRLGVWQIDQLVVFNQEQAKRIQVVGEGK